jgi:phosphatidylglycerophosphate synthase
MKKHEVLNRILLAMRFSAVCAVGLTFLYSRFLGAIAFALLATLLYAANAVSQGRKKQSEVLTLGNAICDRVSLVVFYFLLMFVGQCPSWFVALLITTTLVQATGLLFLKWPEKRVATIVPLKIGRINTGLQFGWLLLAITLLVGNFPHAVSETFLNYTLLSGYFSLAIAQGYVFYRYFICYRTFFLPGFPLFSPAARY